MNPNADPHSPPHAPVHLSSAGCSSTTPSSPVVGAFGLWGEQSDGLRSPAAAMGSFVNKAKAIWRGKRHSYQWAGSADLRGDKDTSRPATQRQATLPLLPLPTTFGGFSRRPTRRRNGGSIQISSPTLISGPSFALAADDIWPLDTEADVSREFIHIRSSRTPGYERRSSLPAGIDGHSKCDRYSRSLSASTLVPPDTSYLTVAPPRAGSVPNLRGCGSTEFAPSVNVPSEHDGVCCASPRMMDGMELGVSDTMMAISEAGLLQHSESEELEEDVGRLREALANMFPMVPVETEGSLVGVESRDDAEPSHDVIDRCLEDKDDSPLYPLHPQERDQFGQPGDQFISESPSKLTLATDVVQSLWAPRDPCQPHPCSSSVYQLEVQSLVGPQPVEIVANETHVPELDVMIEPTATVSRPILQPLHIDGVASRSTLHVPSSMPPRVPARSPSRPNLGQRSCSSPATSTVPETSPRAPRSRTPEPIHSNASTLSKHPSEYSYHTARSRRTTRSLFVESQVAQVMPTSPVPGSSRTGSLPRKGRSQSRLAKMKSKSRSIKKPTPADISKPIQTNEWVVVSSASSRVLHPRRKASRSSIRKSLYAQSSISSRRSVVSRASSTRTGIVKSPSIRSGLTSLSAKPELRASQSRSVLHTRSRAGLYSHGVNPKLSAVALRMSGVRSSPSTRSLPGASKENLTPTEPPHRPARSPARPYPERRLEDMNEKENQPTPIFDGTSPIEFTLQLTAPFEAAIDRRFARSNFTVSPPTPGLQRSRTTKARPAGMSRKKELNEIHALVAGIGAGGAPLRRSPTIAVPPRNPARVAMGARSGNWI